MLWFVAALFVLGALCGAAIRMLVFVVVLVGAATIAVVAGLANGGGALVDALVTVVVLQLGYVAGMVLRSALRQRGEGAAARPPRVDPAQAPLGGKRR